ncbi:MAG: UvrD-helicase domain-containing protein [Planctomycetes bacterium]|nr:UvrD-helicase domain-containing protein [Planctomycetota bacterium]
MNPPPPVECEGLNDAQRAALDLDRDLLVDAGAGAGKTRVLALRYLALIEEGRAAVPEIVAFTFTDRAAAEMRARVQQYLDGRIAQLADLPGAKDRRERLIRARAEFHRNAISTVHAFCHRVLRRYAWEAGLEPGAPLMDPREQVRARRAAVANVLQRAPAEKDTALRDALEFLGGLTTLQGLGATLGRMLAERHATGPALKLSCAAWADPDAEIARRRKLADDAATEALAPVVVELHKLPVAAAKQAKDGDALKEVMTAVEAGLKGLPGANARGAICAALLTKAGEARKFGKAGATANWKGVTPGLPEVREALMRVAELLADAPEVFELDEQHERLVGRALIHLKTVFDAVVRAFGEECAGRLDFLELELRTLALLKTSTVADEVVSGVRYLLIDEFQDTNPTQFALFDLLSARHHRPGRLFAVGDAKQAIYGFRGSDVGVFNDARSRIPARNTDLAKRAQQLPFGLTCQDLTPRRAGVVSLDTNYRSRPPLLAFGNDLFERMLGGSRRFDAPAQRLIAGVADDNGAKLCAELHVLRAPKRNEDDDDRRNDDEAELTAQRAAALRADGFAWRDIAVLVRRGTNNGDFRAAFARHGIPLLLHDQGGLLKTQEALDCVNLLRVLVDAGDDIAALGLLRSPFCGLSDRALTDIALNDQTRDPLLLRVRRARPSGEEGDVQARFFSMLEDLRRRSDREPPANLLSCAFSACGYALAVGVGPQAEQRLANLERLVDVVGAIASPSLAVVCRELRERMEGDDDEAQAAPDTDGVRLMTIHKSKGMEFPAVIVPDLGNERYPPDTGLLRALPEAGHPAGLYLRVQVGDELGQWRPDFAAWHATQLRRERDVAEEKRVFYTAFTRAMKRLVLIGTVRAESVENPRESWAHEVLQSLRANAWGAQVDNASVRVQWHETIERTPAISNTPEIERVLQALRDNRLNLRRPVETRLVAPLAEPAAAATFDPRAVETGVLVHGAIEQYLKRRGVKQDIEIGMLRLDTLGARASEVEPHLICVRDALALRRKARHELSEWRVFGLRDGKTVERRLDLLRVIDDRDYEIIDFKTDVLGPGDSSQVAAMKYREQLGEYRELLASTLRARGRTPQSIRTYICFTDPTRFDAKTRVVEVETKA